MTVTSATVVALNNEYFKMIISLINIKIIRWIEKLNSKKKKKKKV